MSRRKYVFSRQNVNTHVIQLRPLNTNHEEETLEAEKIPDMQRYYITCLNGNLYMFTRHCEYGYNNECTYTHVARVLSFDSIGQS